MKRVVWKNSPTPIYFSLSNLSFPLSLPHSPPHSLLPPYLLTLISAVFHILSSEKKKDIEIIISPLPAPLKIEKFISSYIGSLKWMAADVALKL